MNNFTCVYFFCIKPLHNCHTSIHTVQKKRNKRKIYSSRHFYKFHGAWKCSDFDTVYLYYSNYLSVCYSYFMKMSQVMFFKTSWKVKMKNNDVPSQIVLFINFALIYNYLICWKPFSSFLAVLVLTWILLH